MISPISNVFNSRSFIFLMCDNVSSSTPVHPPKVDKMSQNKHFYGRYILDLYLFGGKTRRLIMAVMGGGGRTKTGEASLRTKKPHRNATMRLFLSGIFGYVVKCCIRHSIVLFNLL